MLILFCSYLMVGQNGITFYENNFDQAMAAAKAEGKDVFLDTYAPWCKPCKKMDKVFRNSKVANFYNEHFINVKVDVDQKDGKTIADRYGIAFLPTMVILDAQGNVKHRIDGVKTPDEMLGIAQFVVNNVAPPLVERKVIKERELPNKTGGEKILLVIDGKNASQNPEYLYHEAFYRFEKMDESYDSIAIKYLETQEDWSTPRNMTFITSFLENTNSEMFDYFVNQKEAFTEMIGAKKYRNTLEILINNCLYRQIPRPEPEEVEVLYRLLYPRKAEKYTYQYLLKRYEEEENYGLYVKTGEAYLETLLQPDPDLLYKLGKYKCLSADKKDLKECVFRVEESIRLMDQPDYDQYLTLAKLYLKLGKERKAVEAAEMSGILSLGDTVAQSLVDEFLAKLERS